MGLSGDRMFRLITANDAAVLADRLGDGLRAPAANPLLPARVLVPQAGLARWLQVRLAERNGVIANVAFTPPAQFAWELLRAAQPTLPQHSPYEVELLRWHVYALLGEPLDGRALAPLRAYLAANADPLARYALSFELARVYERMQGYRRATLHDWERGAHGGWQAELWRRLVRRVGGVSRAARMDDWLRRFDAGFEDTAAATPKPAPPLPDGLTRFACFACANVSPDVLRMLAVAGQHCDVDFYLPLPSMEYLGDVPRTRAAVRARLGEGGGENPLVTSLGGAAAEFIEQLYGYQYLQPDAEIDAFDDAIAGERLLDRVRNDVLRHRVPPADAARLAAPDASLQFHACHTEVREVETLHDALLALFTTVDGLRPRDIAVMAPDIERYRPAIEAVFGGDRKAARALPYNLGDLGAGALHPVAELFLQLLDAPTSRWEVDALTDLLAVPGVQRRFDLDADAAAQLGRRVHDAGVRWGEDETARQGCGGYREFSWAFGLDRIVAGFASGDDLALAGDTAPLAGVEGSAFGQLDALLALTATFRHLRELAGRRQQARDWQVQLNAALDALYRPDPDDSAETRALDRIRAALKRLADNTAAAGGGLDLAFADVRAFLRDALAAPAPQQRLFTGGITFCSLVPLRVVPFRVICLLGMDADAFPHRDDNGLDPLVHDRRTGHAQPGDRDVRADDRLLFLQLLAAARDAFYVSWIGRDAHDNQPRPPSVVVAELIDCLRDHYLERPPSKAGTDRLPRLEPLHPFARELFADDADAARSFQAQWLPAANAPTRTAPGVQPFVGAALPAAPGPATLRLDELKRFFDDPARGFLEQRLDLRLPRDAEAEPGVEPLQPDAPLLRYDLTRAGLEGGDTELATLATQLRAEARLPPGGFGGEALAIARERAENLRGSIADYTGGGAALDAIVGDLELAGGVRLTGQVDAVYPAGLVRAKAGSLEGRHVLRAYIDQLFATAVRGAPVPCRLFWLEKDAGKYCDLAPCDPADAIAKLDRLVALHQRGLVTPLPLLTRACWKALGRERKTKGDNDEAAFITRLREAAGGDERYQGGSEFTSPTLGITWRGMDFTRLGGAAGAAFYRTTLAVFPQLVWPARARTKR